MRRALGILMLFFATMVRLYAQDEVEDIHALLKQLRESKADTNRTLLLLRLSSLYLPDPENNIHIKDSALLMAVQAKELSARLNYPRGKSDADYWVGLNYIKRKEFPAFNSLLQEAEDTVKINLMLAMASYLLKVENKAASTIDSANNYGLKALALSESVHSITLKTNSLLQLAACAAEQGNFKKAKDIWQQSFKWSSHNNYFDGESDTYAAIAPYCSMDTSLLKVMDVYYEIILTDQKKIVASKALEAGQSKLAERMVDVALRFWDQNNMELTLKQLLLAIEYGKKCIRPDIGPYYNIVYLYLYKGDFSKSLFYALEAVRIVEKTGNILQDERPYMNIGKVYSDMGKYDLALTYYDKAVALISKKGFLVNGTLLRLIAEADILLKKPAAALPFLLDYLNRVVVSERIDRMFVLESAGYCYSELRQFDEAEKYLLHAVALASQSPSVTDRYNSNEVLGRLYLKQGKFEKARFYIQQVLKDSSIALEILKREAHFMLFRIDSSSGNYLSAIQHLNISRAMHDAAFNTQKNKEVEELRVKYETEKKEQNIQLLVKQAELQSADLRESRYLRNGLIGGAIMLALLLIILYNRYHLKQKSNYLLEQQKQTIYLNNKNLQQLNLKQQKLLSEKEWLIKEVHHRVKNNLQLVLSLLNMQKDYVLEEGSLNTFAEIGSRIRAISLIHQKLYQVHDLTMISMPEYIRELVSYIEESCKGAEIVSYDIQIDDIQLDAAQSVPVGLIINEAVTNSIKYAFSSRNCGRITIRMTQLRENYLQLIIADNGVGLPEYFNWKTHESMGIDLINILSDQLEADLQIQSSEGVIITLSFQKQISELETVPASNIPYSWNTDHLPVKQE